MALIFVFLHVSPPTPHHHNSPSLFMPSLKSTRIILRLSAQRRSNTKIDSCSVTKLDNTMMMHSRAEKDSPRHGTCQNGTARVSTHDSTTDVCAGLTRPCRLDTVGILPDTNHYACLTITPKTLPLFPYVLYLCLYV